LQPFVPQREVRGRGRDDVAPFLFVAVVASAIDSPSSFLADRILARTSGMI
jgi:hypothetical protein